MAFGYACDRCRQKHQSCDHQFPCQRCVKASCAESCHYTPKRARTRRICASLKYSPMNSLSSSSSSSSSSLSLTSASSVFGGVAQGAGTLASLFDAEYYVGHPGTVGISFSGGYPTLHPGNAVKPTMYNHHDLAPHSSSSSNAHPASHSKFLKSEQLARDQRISYAGHYILPNTAYTRQYAASFNGQYPIGQSSSVNSYSSGGQPPFPSIYSHQNQSFPSAQQLNVQSPMAVASPPDPAGSTPSHDRRDYHYINDQAARASSAYFNDVSDGSHIQSHPSAYPSYVLPCNQIQQASSNFPFSLNQTDNQHVENDSSYQKQNDLHSGSFVNDFSQPNNNSESSFCDFSQNNAENYFLPNGELAQISTEYFPVSKTRLNANGNYEAENQIPASYPSSELLDGIHYSTSKLHESIAEGHSRYYSYDSSALLASGVLIQEYVKEALSYIGDDLRLSETLPNSSSFHENDIFNDFIESKQPPPISNLNSSSDSLSSTEQHDSIATNDKSQSCNDFYEHPINSSVIQNISYRNAKNQHGVSQNIQNQSVLSNQCPVQDSYSQSSTIPHKYPSIIAANGNNANEYGQAHFPPFLHL